ncbi:MAG: hypothetical protein WAT40_10515 [Saprospiraceae bacterium]
MTRAGLIDTTFGPYDVYGSDKGKPCTCAHTIPYFQRSTVMTGLDLSLQLIFENTIIL